MIDVRVGIPYAKIEFATEKGDITVEQKAMVHDLNMDLDIISVNTTRDIGSDDCATFSIELVYKDKWYEAINGNDFVKIELGRGYVAKPVLFGMVDTVYKSWNFIDLKPVRTIRINGRGFNKALIQFGIGAVQEVNLSWGLTGFFYGQDTGFGLKTAADVIKTVIDYYTSKGIDMSFANGKRWIDYARFIYIPAADEKALANIRNHYTYQGGLWDYIKELRNAPFNEVYWEVIGGKPTFVVRPTPFNPGKWRALQQIKVEDIDIIDQNVGRTDLENYTVYVVKAEHFVDAMNMVYGHPIWYKPNYRKYGLRRLQINSKYIYEEEYPDRGETGINTPGRNCYIDGEDEAGERQINAGAGDDGDVSQKTIDLFNWNIKNNAMENGSILLKGDVKYKIGTRLYIKSEDMEYYIENVSHTFIYNEDWKTTVEVTRGIKPSKRFTKPWNQWAKLTALDMEEIMGIDISYAQNKAQAPGKPGKPGAPNTPGASEESILGKIGKWAKRKANGATMVNPTGDATAAISSPFGNRQHPISGQWKQHNGLDIPGANGSPMYAAQDGTVSFVGYDSGGYGNYIIIDHGGGMTTLYGHAHSLSAKEGQKVSAGEQIGKIGSTGGSTGPHIHFEVKQDGTPIDPYPFLYGKR